MRTLREATSAAQICAANGADLAVTGRHSWLEL